ncbi:MAG: hypothetical protein DRP01_01385 [Archaeoglobales archaeon]|nr:MAG: hypothetical protein DRP01_01385 [Archaeoglobales archaeon]
MIEKYIFHNCNICGHKELIRIFLIDMKKEKALAECTYCRTILPAKIKIIQKTCPFCETFTKLLIIRIGRSDKAFAQCLNCQEIMVAKIKERR